MRIFIGEIGIKGFDQAGCPRISSKLKWSDLRLSVQ